MNFYAGTGSSMLGTTSVILLLIIKLLLVLFIIGLVVGIALVIKNCFFSKEDVERIKSNFTSSKSASIKESCGICSKELDEQWKVCPYCGKETQIA